MLDTIRKVHVTREETRLECGAVVEPPMITVIVAAVMRNPWAGTPPTEDLRPVIKELAPQLGAFMGDQLLEAFGSAEAIEAYGKGSVVGVDGELEHAAAAVHTLLFGEQIRKRVDGASTLVFANTRGGPGAPITVPMVHKGELLTRSHYHTAQTSITDAPRPDEIVVLVGGASRSRPFPRLGDRDTDKQDIADAGGA